MACNCATNEQIAELYRRYGEKKRISKGQKIGFRIKNAFTKIGVALCMAVLTPIMAIYVFYKVFGSEDHKISVREFFNLKKKEIGTNVG